MKNTILSILLLLPLSLIAQKPFTIDGDIKNLKNGDLIRIIYSVNGKSLHDSAHVYQGKFRFKGTINEVVPAEIFKNMDHASFFLEAGNIKISSPDSVVSSVITGTKTNRDSEKLKLGLKPFMDQIKVLREQYNTLTKDEKNDKVRMKSLEVKYAQASDGMTPIVLKFIAGNPKSFISLNSLQMLAENPKIKPRLPELFATLSSEIKETKAGRDLAMLIGASGKTAIGVIATDFSQNDTNGVPVKLSDFRGKYVLLDFWASWCGPCRAENPNVVAAYAKFKDKNFTVLGISLDRPGDRNAWLKAIADDKLSWTNVSDLKFWDNEVAKAWGIQSVPANFLIDPNGKIIAKGLRGQELHKKLTELLNAADK